MAEKNKKYNRPPTGIKPRNKQTHAQYVWVREMFLRQDELASRISIIEKFLGLDRKVYKEEDEHKGGGTP